MGKKFLSLIIMLALLGSLCLFASAHEVPDFDRLGSISLSMRYDGKPVPGGSLTIHRVADVVSDNGDMIYMYTLDFSSCTIPETELNNTRLPGELSRIADLHKLPGTTQKLDDQGKTRFSGLKIGLYLVVQNEAAPGYSKINPFLVSVPQNEQGHYVYDVETSPKTVLEPEPKPTEPKPTEPAKPPADKLPQTGQTNWPVPVMAAAGLILLMAGICLRVTEKRKREDA